MSKWPGAKRSGTRSCTSRSEMAHSTWKGREEGKTGYPYCIKAAAPSVQKKLDKVPFHARVLEHMSQPIELYAVQQRDTSGRTERHVGADSHLTPPQRPGLGYGDESRCGRSAKRNLMTGQHASKTCHPLKVEKVSRWRWQTIDQWIF